jgi:hypothetical protein
MPESSPTDKVVYWPRVKEILDGIMDRWKQRWSREPFPGIHVYYWETPQQLKTSVLSGRRAIQPGVPGRETNLIKSLAAGVGTSGRMPMHGPFLSREELEEIIAWIDAGTPEGPPSDPKQAS